MLIILIIFIAVGPSSRLINCSSPQCRIMTNEKRLFSCLVRRKANQHMNVAARASVTFTYNKCQRVVAVWMQQLLHICLPMSYNPMHARRHCLVHFLCLIATVAMEPTLLSHVRAWQQIRAEEEKRRKKVGQKQDKGCGGKSITTKVSISSCCY